MLRRKGKVSDTMRLLSCWIPGYGQFNRKAHWQQIVSRCRLWAFALLFAIALPTPSVIAAKASAKLVLFDQWVETDQPVWLRARLISKGGSILQSMISGERIEFRVDGQVLGPVLTGGNGLAAARYLPPKTGTYIIKAALVDNPRYEASEAEALLLYGRLGRRVIVVLLDTTQTLQQLPRFPFIPARPPQPMPGAPRVLEELSEEYQLVYIQKGSETQLLEVRDWLDKQGFPKAPLFYWRLSAKPESRTRQMMEQLNKLKPFARLYLGMTRSASDAQAFLSLRMKAVILSEDTEVEMPEGSKVITDWDNLSLLISES